MNKNGKPRQSASPGMTLMSRVETDKEFGARLNVDIGERPEHYFARREIPLLEDHLTEFQAEVWQTGQLLIQCRNRKIWFKSVGRMTCGFCDYKNLCLLSIRVEPGDVPAGYERLDDSHPELREEEE